MKVVDLFARLGLQPDRAQWQRGDRLVSGLKKAIVGLVAIQTGRWFKGMIDDVRASADRYNKMSQQVGISTEALQQLEFAAKIGGTNVEVLAKGIQRLAKNSNDARNGLSTPVRAFEQLFGNRVTAQRVANMTDLDEQLMLIADQMATLPDDGKKTAIAMDLFGKSGAQLLPTLNLGREGIADLRQEFVDLGGQIDESTGAEFEQLNDDMLRVETVLRGIKQQFVIALLPVIKDLTARVLEWVKANKELLRARVRAWARALGKVLLLLGKTIDFVIRNWKALLVLWGVSKTLGTLIALTSGIRVAIVAIRLFGWAAVQAGLQMAAAWIMAAAPFVLIGLVITALILIIQDLYTWINGGDSVLKGLWESFKEYVVDKLHAAWDRVFGDMQDIAEDFFDWIIPKLEWLGNKIEETMDLFTGTLIDQGVIDELTEQRQPRKLSDSARRSIQDVIAVQQTIGDIATGATLPAANNTTNSSASTITVSPTINVDGSKDPKATADAIVEELNRVAREAAAMVPQ